MNSEQGTWTTTTHDWSQTVDIGHLQWIRQHPEVYAAGGVQHLVLEVLAYAADEAEALGRRVGSGRRGRCVVTRHDDGSLSVTDDGRGTDTRRDAEGRIVRKPVMATRDLRFFGQEAQVLPDGRPRHGMSVVAALSRWLEHTNRRLDGAWTQRYEHGVPVDRLIELPPSGATGTTVRLLPDATVLREPALDPAFLHAFAGLDVQVR